MSESVLIVDRPANFNAAVNSPLTTEIFSSASRRGNNLGGRLTQMHKFTNALLMKLAATIKGSRLWRRPRRLEKLVCNQPTEAAPRSDLGFGVTQESTIGFPRGRQLALRRNGATDLHHTGQGLDWWAHKDSNLGPAD